MFRPISWRQRTLTLNTNLSFSRFLSQFHSEDIYDPPFSLISTAQNPPKKPLKPKKKKIQVKDSLNSKEVQEFPVKSDLPFDFRYSYSEMNPLGFENHPSSLLLDRVGTAAPAQQSVDLAKVAEKMNAVPGEPLSDEEIPELVERYRHSDCSRQINLGKGGVTHNMIDDIHNHWKKAEAVRGANQVLRSSHT